MLTDAPTNGTPLWTTSSARRPIGRATVGAWFGGGRPGVAPGTVGTGAEAVVASAAQEPTATEEALTKGESGPPGVAGPRVVGGARGSSVGLGGWFEFETKSGGLSR